MDHDEALRTYQAARARLADETLPFPDLVRLCESMAGFAAHNSLGFLTDPLMEARLAGAAVRPSQPGGRSMRGTAGPRRILHYATRTHRVGGHSRLIANWIDADLERTHDLVLREPSDLPFRLIDALHRCGGVRHMLGGAVETGRFAQARTLHDLASRYDAVVLHAHPDDAVPMLAFAAGAPCPVIVDNHADHVFWLGSMLGNLVVCSRAEAIEMCVSRRGIPPERCAFQPWPMPDLAKYPVSADRATVRAMLGLGPRTQIVLSAAHTWKYVSESGTFFSAFEQFLDQRPDTVLCVVGASASGLGRAPRDKRILLPGVAEDLELLYVTSDAYVDSYPVFTGMATLEAFAYGLPILSTDLSEDIPGRPRLEQPGLPRHLFHYSKREDFFAALGRLLDSPEEREAQRLRLSPPFNAQHGPEVTRQSLEAVYRLASSHHRGELLGPTRPTIADLDIQITQTSGFYRKTFNLAGLAVTEIDVPSSSPNRI